jgi:hypothetical protein
MCGGNFRYFLPQCISLSSLFLQSILYLKLYNFLGSVFSLLTVGIYEHFEEVKFMALRHFSPEMVFIY